MKAKISVKELKAIYEYAVEHHDENNLVTLYVEPAGMGVGFSVSKDWDDPKPFDVTDYSTW